MVLSKFQQPSLSKNMAIPPIKVLNDDCLTLVLNCLSLDHLLKCQLVCKHWRIIILKFVCHQKHSLKILSTTNFFKFRTPMNSCRYLSPVDDILIIPKLTPEICQQIGNIFPNINQVTFEEKLNDRQLQILLSKWQSLEAIQFSDDFLNWQKAWPLIQNQKLLKDLHLMDTFFLDANETYKFDLSILNQLEEFEIDTQEVCYFTCWIPNFNGNVPDVLDILPHLNKAKIRSLGILDPSRMISWKPLIGLADKFRNLTHLKLNADLLQSIEKDKTNVFSAKEYEKFFNKYGMFTGNGESLIDFICINFVSLQTLILIDISFEARIYFLLPSFAKLQHLQNLSLSLSENSLFSNIEAHKSTLVPLFSVKFLHLQFDLLPGEIDYLPTIFPKIQNLTINLDMLNCNCYPSVPLYSVPKIKSNRRDCSRCIKLVIQNLSTHPSLKKLIMFAENCSDNVIKSLIYLETSPINYLDLSNCKKFSFKCLLRVLNVLALKRKDQINLIVRHTVMNNLNRNNSIGKNAPNLRIVSLPYYL